MTFKHPDSQQVARRRRQREDRRQRFASPKERLFAGELTRAGIQWEYAPRIGSDRVADFRLPNHGGLLIEVYSGKGELRKSALPNCLVMPCDTREGMHVWINEMLGNSSTS